MPQTSTSHAPEIPHVCRDPDDDHVLAAALAAGEEIIVTGDDDLLTLHEYEGVRIPTSGRFSKSLPGERRSADQQ